MRASCDPAFCHFIDAGGDCEDCWYERTKARIAREKATCLEGEPRWMMIVTQWEVVGSE